MKSREKTIEQDKVCANEGTDEAKQKESKVLEIVVSGRSGSRTATGISGLIVSVYDGS